MKLVGELKKQVEETNSKEEAKEVIEKAGMQLTDEELDNVTGGRSPFPVVGASTTRMDSFCTCGNPVKSEIQDVGSGYFTCQNCGGIIH